jgi:hypothetical protein
VYEALSYSWRSHECSCVALLQEEAAKAGDVMDLYRQMMAGGGEGGSGGGSGSGGGGSVGGGSAGGGSIVEEFEFDVASDRSGSGGGWGQGDTTKDDDDDAW